MEPDKPKLKCRLLVGVSYLGNKYNGFQKQPHMSQCVTIQDRLERALTVAGYTNTFVFTGSRTDSKINAVNHPVVVDIFSSEPISLERSEVKRKLNEAFKVGQDDISVLTVDYLDKGFVYNRAVREK